MARTTATARLIASLLLLFTWTIATPASASALRGLQTRPWGSTSSDAVRVDAEAAASHGLRWANPNASTDLASDSPYAPRAAGKGAGKASKVFSGEKKALVDMAKADKRTGISKGDMQAYKDLNKQLSDPFPSNKVRGPEVHPTRPHGKTPHGHVGPIDHIPIID